MLLSGPVLFLSLFLTWSHQFSPSFLATYAHTAALRGLPRDPTGWQVYSIADVLLALLAAGLVAVALGGSRPGRIIVLMGLVAGLAFVIHALAAPPTDGASLFDAATGTYAPNRPGSGAGEIVALIGLAVGMGGVLVSLTAD